MFRALPCDVWILGKRWTLEEQSAAQSRKKGSLTREGLYGVTHPSARKIIIAYGLSPELREITILHELLHAVYSATGDEMLGHALEEHLVGLIDDPLHKVLTQVLHVTAR